MWSKRFLGRAERWLVPIAITTGVLLSAALMVALWAVSTPFPATFYLGEERGSETEKGELALKLFRGMKPEESKDDFTCPVMLRKVNVNSENVAVEWYGMDTEGVYHRSLILSPSWAAFFNRLQPRGAIYQGSWVKVDEERDFLLIFAVWGLVVGGYVLLSVSVIKRLEKLVRPPH